MAEVPLNEIVCGDCLEVMKQWPDGCVDMCVTSPPYWGLRDYGVKGQLGLEKTPQEYVAKMVEVFREVRRVLADHGTLWLNLGDSYASASACDRRNIVGNKSPDSSCRRPNRLSGSLKEKDLVGIPWMLAFALRDDGWWLRSDIIWAKPNPMPESCQDRPTKAHEYLFLLSKRKSYFYDQEAIREPMADSSIARISQETFDTQTGGPKDYGHRTNANRSARKALCNLKEKLVAQEKWGDRYEGWDARDKSVGRNKRTVWTIPTQPMPEAHFATYPEKLVEPCILAGCPKEVCRVCGKPRERVIEKTGQSTYQKVKTKSWREMNKHASDKGLVPSRPASGQTRMPNGTMPHLDATPLITIGFTDCGHGDYRYGRVLDPFGGSGTTGVVAGRLKRDYVLIELSEEYAETIARPRLAHIETGVPPAEARKGQKGLWE
ncbi:MAG: DNA-methyltransferase [Planctomycetota bacterium]|jgi:DNA modification methylase